MTSRPRVPQTSSPAFNGLPNAYQSVSYAVLETIDLDKDPYFFKNHVGSFECRLCLTVHQNDGSYLAHTQGRKHQTNLYLLGVIMYTSYNDSF
jgi:hypothetical protein